MLGMFSENIFTLQNYQYLKNLASFNGFSDILECLLKKNANLNIKDKNGKTALMLGINCL
jgi:ankyrin repeat protein